MSLKNLFDGKNPYKLLSSEILDDLGAEVESSGNIQERLEEKNRFIPIVNYDFPENFARYGKASKYYEDSFNRITNDYPYDGSLREKTKFRNESSYLDLYILDNKYPRTTGHAIFSPNGWGTPTATAPSGIALPSIVEFVQVKGGPNQAPDEFLSKPTSQQFPESNKYDSDNNRESNLKFDFDQGVTVEFWMNKGDFISSTLFEVPFMLSNEDSGSLRIAIATSLSSPTDNSIYAMWTSGSTSSLINYTGIENQEFTGSWHHFAFTFQNSGSSIVSKAYLDGDLKDTQATSLGAPIAEVTGTLKANVGAARKLDYSAAFYDVPADGYGKLSGSIDEFRYWKTVRTSEQIGRYWFTDVGGGTNDDLANVDLGVYFKFNEGITSTTSIDSNVLDYSGRISNGAWTGYTAQARSTTSAIDTYFNEEVEFKDPIIYSAHPDVTSVKSDLIASGSEYDYQNNASIYNSVPTWVLEEDELAGSELLNLTQIMASYFDTLHIQIKTLPDLKNKLYNDPKLIKPTTFSSRLLQSHGFVAPEIFADANVLSQILTRDEDQKFELDLYDIKNTIYQNIYNNLTNIYKSKGTEKSFRNLIRCFGVDEELIRINVYGNNSEYELRDNFRADSVKKKYADFNDPDRFAATVYQQTSSANPNSVSYIEGSTSASFNPFTVEAEVIFPKKLENSNSNYFPTPFLSSSLFGFHAASSTATDYTWQTPDTDLKVYAVRQERESEDITFVLEASQLGVLLETDVFYDTYDNNKWNLSVRIKPEKVGVDLVDGTSDTNYILEFTGYNLDAGVVVDQFYLTSSVSNIQGYTTSNKRLYLGAHRTNFTGSALEQTDVKISSLRYWASYLDNEVLLSHARDPSSAGAKNPYESAYLYETSLSGVYVPQIETLALNWDFETVTTSDASGQYLVEDVSSGSVDLEQRYGWLGPVVKPQHTGLGDFYLANDQKVVDVKFVYGGIKTNPEISQASNMINVLGESDIYFNRDTRPIEYYYSIEKSMYQVVSDEMLKMFSTILDFNNLIGDPVNKYRQNYKPMDKLRSLFFERVENTPDLDRYVEFYKWLDDSLGVMLRELVPASAVVSDEIRTMVESHVLERNKYQHKLPTVELKEKDTIYGIKGVNDALLNWKFYHHPISDLQDENCQWWNERAERTNSVISSGDAGVDADRQQILEARVSALNRRKSTPYRLNVQEAPQIGGGSNVRAPKALDVARNQIKFGTTNGIELTQQKDFKDCTDELLPNEKRKIEADMSAAPNVEYLNVDFNQYFPYTLFSSSVGTGYQDGLTYALENVHRDTYGHNLGTPMQGPFTETHVGGLQFRHAPLNIGTDDITTRAEGWNLETSPALKITSVDTDNPRAPYYRDETAKRPLNIKNIKGDYGNYTKDYQIVQTNSRYINNRAWVSASGWQVPSPTYWVTGSGLATQAKIQRGRTEHVFVNRFSAPGGPETMGDSDGGPGLDRYSAEFSPNNDMNTRNIAVREDFNQQLSSHVNQFGFFSGVSVPGATSSSVNAEDYSGTASIYQVNRNGLDRLEYSGSDIVTASFYDNYFVQHAIPRPERDFTYNWSGSLIGDYMSYLVPLDAEAYFGASSASISASATEEPYIKTAYNGLNYTIYEPIDPDTAFLGYETASTSPSQINYYNRAPVPIDYSLYELAPPNEEQIARVLNAITLKRQGPYGHPTWKQIRTGEHPLARYYRNNNQYTVTEGSRTILLNGQQYNPKYGSTSTFKEMPINSKMGNLEYVFGIRSEKGDPLGEAEYTVTPITVKTVYGNNISYFDNERLNQIAQFDKTSAASEEQAYGILKSYYLDGGINDVTSPIYNLVSLKYSERMYPSSINCYRFENRERVGYQNTFWRNARSDRNTLGELKFNGSSSQGVAREQSAWALDGATQFDESNSIGTSTPVAQITGGVGVASAHANMYETCSAGELQNDYTFCWQRWNKGKDEEGPTQEENLVGIEASPIYARPQDLQSIFSVVNPTGNEFLNKVLSVPASRSLYFNPFEQGLTSSLNPGNAPYSSSMPSWGVGLEDGDFLGFINGAAGKARFQAHLQAGIVRDGVFITASTTPFYDSYGDFNVEPRLKNKDYSVIPEFRISEEMEFYLKDSAGDFLADNSDFLKIPGTNIVSSDSDFYKDYSYSDFMKYFEVIDGDHGDLNLEKTLTLKCTAVKKFIPYDGFFPAERTLEIASYFKTEYSQFVSGRQNFPEWNKRAVYKPFMAPGILFNTIKSGIAVDYPVYTGSHQIVNYEAYASGAVSYTGPYDTSYYALGTGSSGTSGWDYRIPFEAILDPPQYIGDVDIYDAEANPQIALNFNQGGPTTYEQRAINSAVLTGAPVGKNLYTLGVSNFLAETKEFFLNDYATFSSATDEEGFQFDSGSYGMRIKIRRSKENVASGSSGIYPQDIPSLDDFSYETITMYSKPNAFGPPVAGSSYYISQDNPGGSGQSDFIGDDVYEKRQKNSDSLFGKNPSFTPPYYDGECWMDIFLELTESATLTLDQIFEKAKVYDLRVRDDSQAGASAYTAWPNSAINGGDLDQDLPMNVKYANNFAMKLSSSINPFIKVFDTSEKFSDQRSARWVIQTKFETPVLNFSDKTVRPLTLENITLPINTDATGTFDGGTLMACEEAAIRGYGAQGAVPIGMWHQFGLIPQGEEGIYLSIEDININYLKSIDSLYPNEQAFYPPEPQLMQSLADRVGFLKGDSRKIGRLKEAKTVFEAVVAIPYIIENNERRYFGIDRKKIDGILKQEDVNGTSQEFLNLVETSSEDPEAEFNSIRDMVGKMKKYVLPPKLDFLLNRDIRPFAMYIFEFSHTFDQDDLSYIWQNLTPRGGKKIEEATATISHRMLDNEILKNFKDRVRFQVFKVKQRANNNYYSTIAVQDETKTRQLKYSFNWPYDYFSIVEFAKIDCQVGYGSDTLVKVDSKDTRSTQTLDTGLEGSKSLTPGGSGTGITDGVLGTLGFSED